MTKPSDAFWKDGTGYQLGSSRPLLLNENGLENSYYYISYVSQFTEEDKDDKNMASERDVGSYNEVLIDGYDNDGERQLIYCMIKEKERMRI